MSKTGDLVSVLYETTRYYIVLEQLPRDERGFSERSFNLLDVQSGKVRYNVKYSEIKVVSGAPDG